MENCVQNFGKNLGWKLVGKVVCINVVEQLFGRSGWKKFVEKWVKKIRQNHVGFFLTIFVEKLCGKLVGTIVCKNWKVKFDGQIIWSN